MSKIVMTLCLPEPKVRKRAVRTVMKHRDRTKYTRKLKHKAAEMAALLLCKKISGAGARTQAVPRQNSTANVLSGVVKGITITGAVVMCSISTSLPTTIVGVEA